MLPLPDPLAVLILLVGILFILLLFCFICQSSHKRVKERQEKSQKSRQNLEFCFRFNVEKKTVSNPKEVNIDPPESVYAVVKKTNFEVPRKLARSMHIPAEVHSTPIHRMNNWPKSA